MAGEIYIADKETLDSVKLDTQALLKVSGGNDIFSMTPIITNGRKSCRASNVTNLLSVTGAGVLTLFQAYLGGNYSNNPLGGIIIVDEIEYKLYYSDSDMSSVYFSGNSNTWYDNVSSKILNINSIIPFNSSLKIQIYNSSSDSRICWYNISYLLK